MEDSRNSTLTVGLLWHSFGHDNLGIDALARGNVALLEQAAKDAGVTISYITMGSSSKKDVRDLPKNVEIGPGASLKALLLGKLDYARTISRCDFVIDIGEGDSFADIYGWKRFAVQAYSKIVVLINRRPLILAPQTIGPFQNPFFRIIASAILRKTESTSARDHLSFAQLIKMGVKQRYEFIDVAFVLPYSKRESSTDKIKVGLNVSGLLYEGGYTGKNELGMVLDYKELTHDLVDYFLNDPTVQLFAFAHVAGGGGRDDDRLAIKKLCKLYPTLKPVSAFATSSDAKTWMSGLDFVIAGRMHACIGAYSAGVPVVPIAYSRKFNGLFGSLNYPFFVDGKTTSTASAMQQIVDWFHERHELAKAQLLGQTSIDAKISAYKVKLVETISSIKGRR